jgi:hypothetical protein
VHFERPHELANCFLFEHSGYATIALEDYAIEHWNKHHVEVAAGAMANPMGITQLSLSGTDYSARYESYLDFPLELHLKNNDGLANCAKVCRVRRWGEGVTRPPLVLDASLDMGGARVAPTLGPTRRGGGGGGAGTSSATALVPPPVGFGVAASAPAPVPGCRLPRRRHPRSPDRSWGASPGVGDAA